MKNYGLIKNPLTLISIFAALTEIVCGVVMTNIESEKIYPLIWFIIIFPSGLVLLFFLTLNFNHLKLYSPSDFIGVDQKIISRFIGIGKKPKNKSRLLNEIKSKGDEVSLIENATLETQSELKSLVKSFNIFNELNFIHLSEGRRLMAEFVSRFFQNVKEILPLEKLEEINIDLENNYYWTLEVIVKSEFLKSNSLRKKEYFVIVTSDGDASYLDDDAFDWDQNPARVTVKEKKPLKASGMIIGSGIDETENAPEELAFFVRNTILSMIKD